MQPRLHWLREVREYKDTLQDMMSLKQCIDAAKECGAPVVSICGGEPLIYPEIRPLVLKELIAKKMKKDMSSSARTRSNSPTRWTSSPRLHT